MMSAFRASGCRTCAGSVSVTSASSTSGCGREVSLDHDLGLEEDVGTGYDVLTWIEQRVATDGSYAPPEIHIHTSNVAARERMGSAVRGIENLIGGRSSLNDRDGSNG